MKKCDSCNACKSVALDSVAPEVNQAHSKYVVVGNMNVGKSTLFAKIRGAKAPSVNIPGITVSVKSGRIKSNGGMVYDTPGIHSIFSSNEDERASRDVLLSPKLQDGNKAIIMVADAKNLKRSIAIALQYAEYGLPMLFVVNMIDEAASRGVEIDYQKLSRELGVEVCTTIAREGIGVNELVARLPHLRPVTIGTKYSEKIEQFISLVHKLIGQE